MRRWLAWAVVFLAIGAVAGFVYGVGNGLVELGYIPVGFIGASFIAGGMWLVYYNHATRPDYQAARDLAMDVVAPGVRPTTVSGEVLVPEPIYQTRQAPPIIIHTWTVRKQPDGRYSVFPVDEKQGVLWDMPLKRDMTADVAWSLANVKRSEIGWIR